MKTLSLKEFCVVGGSDAGSDMEIKLDIYHAGRNGESLDGVWEKFTNNNFLNIPKNGCSDSISGTLTPIGDHATIKIRIEEDDGDTFFNRNEHFSFTFSDVCDRADGGEGDLSFASSDGIFLFKVENIESSAKELCQENRGLSPLAKNGDACSVSRQCASGCCSKNFIGADSCQNDALWRKCEPGYTFRSGRVASDQCGKGSSKGQFNIMSYNLYLIALASDSPLSIDDRADGIAEWFGSGGGDADVVVIQENWLFQDEIEAGMVQAGYCHYIYDDRGSFGSGMAIYSKYPIEEHDFRSFDSLCVNEDCVVDKGVAYAKIKKDGLPIHVFGTHLTHARENHGTRLGQSGLIRHFANEKVYKTSEPVFFAGDFNEDKIADVDKYEALLDSLDADAVKITGDEFSYDPDTNSLINPDTPGASSRREALDFIFYDKQQCQAHPDANFMSCKYLKPTNTKGDDLSDHYPIYCEMQMML
eukprot:CAMPEP_0113598748 /NCGR_PEP_ID=MMETSP0015_2-20120614/41763_1 /TAXON_ID=2838 /ORGANISM="Odontella" /LENGTH=473 /DNA_ID=CAMNT_0000506807 /DNA_START=188 /DNA_END=1606 /DNA_ORIENTATION=+ /assembly_acc=CAM_ASM_000160